MAYRYVGYAIGLTILLIALMIISSMWMYREIEDLFYYLLGSRVKYFEVSVFKISIGAKPCEYGSQIGTVIFNVPLFVGSVGLIIMTVLVYHVEKRLEEQKQKVSTAPLPPPP